LADRKNSGLIWHMPASPTAIALLEFGRLIYEAERRRSDQDPSRRQQAEEQLLDMLRRDRSAWRKTDLHVDTASSNGSITLRVVAYVAYQQLCSTRLGAAVCDVVKAVAGDEPSAVLETRQTISRLLIEKQLELRNNHSVELGKPILGFLAGGKDAPPLSLTEWDLQKAWIRADLEAKRRRARESIQSANMPTAKTLAQMIAKEVVGLDDQVRTIACRLAMHIRRAALIRAAKDPGSPNEAILMIGTSGCGKTFLAETAGKACGVPFAAVDSTSLTAEGYVGLGCDDALKQAILAAKNDLELVRTSMLFFDEFDKRRSSGWDFGGRDVAGASVQQAMLRLLEGCEYQVGGRKGSYDWAPTVVNTRGMFFTLAGAFVGLDQLLGKHGAHGIGFGVQQDSSTSQAYLYEPCRNLDSFPNC
jgi:hypothetical protein